MREFYKAMLARDARFDGKFFVGVKTTGIYCRPICPAQPKPENVEFFPDAAAAERAGYRPCLRCRPESAPRSAAWFGKKAVVQRALKLIAVNQFHVSNESEFAARLGLSARHLRRLFDDEIGQTPKQISDNNRLNFTRKLIVETNLPLRVVAQVAGFGSLRRFNDVLRRRFCRAPSQLRRAPSSGRVADGFELSLSYRPPYDWQAILDFYRSHLVEGVELVSDGCFERVFRLGETVGALRVRPVPDRAQLQLTVFTDKSQVLFEVVSRVRGM
ncbi:MAG: DNA-3-methyladenine glycosylase 2 family protein, partial [Deltaproteobacteria bacterium]|nr:DNA-3-methyladenine glycosylase 2 family protein [Deltaproteobacteria bacterium]